MNNLFRRTEKFEEATKKNGKMDSPLPRIHPFRQALPQILATTAKNILLLGYGMTLGFPTIVIPSLMISSSISNTNVTIENVTSKHNLMSDTNITFNNSDPSQYLSTKEQNSWLDTSNNQTMNSFRSDTITNKSTGIQDPALSFDPYQLTLTREQISWFSSINLICVPLGCILSGILTQPFGRKPSMMAINIPFMFAWLIYHYATSVGMLYAAVALTGFSGGVLEAPVLTYVAEITTPQLRGMLSATASMVVILGVFVQFIFGSFVHWRTIALINVVFPVIAICALCGVPESPHWLIVKGRIEDAEKSLQWLRGWVKSSQVQAELSHLVKAIQSSISQEQKEAPSWEAFTKRSFIHPYILVSMAFFVGHFCGMTTLQTFAVSIFAELGTPIDKYVATLLLGLVQLLGALMCVVLVHWTGKRPLALISMTGCGICFTVVAVYAQWLSPQTNDDAHSWVPVIFLVISAFMTHMCIRLLPWILIGEVYPPEVRGIASGASGSIGYIFGFIANKSYFKIVDTVHLSGTFFLNAVISFFGALYLFYQLPETEGKTLVEIQDHFAGVRLLNNEKGKQKENWAADNPALENTESNL
ncbi:facilitated trehalose transporter Tret1-like isoform X1 [Lycorma delicatula]|uniref:facilitated trehalose transporter Tret1-like isoform X1 n=1 Tax=Lycorma delicatula TaxID=130591 RepID=UPI003F5152F8